MNTAVALDFTKVHLFERVPGSMQDALVATNLYKAFMRAVGEDGEPVDAPAENGRRKRHPLITTEGKAGLHTEEYYVQGGRWFGPERTEIAYGDVPDWVWVECRAMAPEHRGTYRILLPEEKDAGLTMPTFEDAPEFPPATTIYQALMALDPKNDAHWCADGKPQLKSVSKLVGVAIDRKRLDREFPKFLRPGNR